MTVMTRESDKNREKAGRFAKRMRFLKDRPALLGILHVTNKVFTGILFVGYPVLLLWLYRFLPQLLLRAILVPLDSFIVLSAFRLLVNRRRPYEVYGTAPAIDKKTKGKSFPSRHVFSAVVIALTALFLLPHPIAGIAGLVLAAGIAAVRVATGVHFVSDVLCGAAFAAFSAWIGYIIFPW